MKTIQKFAVTGLISALIMSPRASAQCPGLKFQTNKPVAGVDGQAQQIQYFTDQYVWFDSNCRRRSASLITHDQYPSIGRSEGPQAKQFTYTLPAGDVRTVSEIPGPGGFGYIVSHLQNRELATSHDEDDSPYGSDDQAQGYNLVQGKHHAVHQFTLNYPRWGTDPAGNPKKYNMPVTIQWLFATGHDHPLWIVTFDLSAAPDGAVVADTRSPYGDMVFDGAPVTTFGGDLGGAAWGERYQFKTPEGAGPLTLNSAWDWTQWNSIANYALLWTQTIDAEMGIAGTLVSGKTVTLPGAAGPTLVAAGADAGGYTGFLGRGLSSATSSCQDDEGIGAHTLPCVSGWPYQLVNYSFSGVNDPTPDKRLAWGSDFGYLGQSSTDTINSNKVQGWPRVSYSVFITLGAHSDKPTVNTAMQAAAADETTLTATVGTVLTQGPAGINRADTMYSGPAGYNPVYATWEVEADNNQAKLQFRVAGVPLNKPILVIHNYFGDLVPNVVLDGVTLANDTGFYASYRADHNELWLTLNTNMLGQHNLAIN